MAHHGGYLTTHVLDTVRGVPAGGMRIDLHRVDGDARTHLRTVETNADGRTDTPLLPRDEFAPGVYELTFHAGAYLDRIPGRTGASRFLDLIPIRFGVDDASAHYHVPLLLSAYGYATYRGS